MRNEHVAEDWRAPGAATRVSGPPHTPTQPPSYQNPTRQPLFLNPPFPRSKTRGHVLARRSVTTFFSPLLSAPVTSTSPEFPFQRLLAPCCPSYDARKGPSQGRLLAGAGAGLGGFAPSDFLYAACQALAVRLARSSTANVTKSPSRPLRYLGLFSLRTAPQARSRPVN